MIFLCNWEFLSSPPFRLSGMPYIIAGGGGLLNMMKYLGEHEICVVFCFILNWFLGFSFYFLIGSFGIEASCTDDSHRECSTRISYVSSSEIVK